MSTKELLMLSHINNNDLTVNDLAPDDVEFLLNRYAKDITYEPAADNFDIYTGHGLLDAANVMEHINRDEYIIRHYYADVVVPVIGVAANVTLYINDGIHPPGSYSGNYRIYAYTNYHSLNPGDVIVDSWPLNSYTNTLEPGLGGLVGLEKSEFGMGLGAVSLTSAYCFGSVVLVTKNSLGDPITPFWYPHAPDEITKFGYTLHIKTAYAGVNELDNKVDFSFYPNPTEEFLNLTFLMEDASDVSLVVTDINGRLVHNETFNHLTQGQQKRQVNVESLSKGVYSIQVTINDKTYYEKFIKQ